MSKTFRLAIHGGGRMGRASWEAARDDARIREAVLVARGGADWAPADALLGSLDEVSDPPELLIDFTLPDGTAAAARWCASHGVALVSGTTGLENRHFDALDAAAEHIPVLWAPNMSRGVNAMLLLAAQAARMLPADTPVELLDVHHAGKKDAPSGTAKALADAVAGARGEGGPIEVRSVREGQVIGDHELRFLLQGEELALRHHAADRGIWARGALDAGAWLLGQPPGRYGAAEWLGRDNDGSG